ncbi:MAG: ABC transporter permease [Ignavibacteriales bacterium]|nr:ABC transporter permease [Ignavibacteriales bacterium]MCF8306643.1 ABC transporter permease [Ignavibacteriales bacterium]MCF8316257.1 ABC transporter permease [Ignavibacteriales bacterium]MCF8437841.1 ABC transporter permease [Ignavibacteriales bacterium]
MLNRIMSVLVKEIRQLRRDTKLLIVIFTFPAFLLVMFGYAVNFDVQNIRIGISDGAKNEMSRQIIEYFSSSDYFLLVSMPDSPDDIIHLLDEKKVQAVIVIPSDISIITYGKGKNPQLQFLIDGVDGNTATIIKNYFNLVVTKLNSQINSEILAKYGRKFSAPIEPEIVLWFNPELKSTRFLLPGLIAMILVVTAVVTVSLSLVREKERGTIEQINVSSINNTELLIGKSTPYVAIAFINAALVLLAGYLFFDVSVKGNYFLLMLTTLIFLFASTSIGVFISVISDSQQVAFTAATLVSMLPSLLLSGFIFPIESMPFIIQLITNLSPAKFYLVTLRAIILKGSGLGTFYMQLFYLIIFGLIFLGLSIVIRKKESVSV